jgi:hypothetical protein
MAEKKKSFGKLIARKLFGGKARLAKKDKKKEEYDDRKKKAESKYPKRLKKLMKKGKEARDSYEFKLRQKFWSFMGGAGMGTTKTEKEHYRLLKKKDAEDEASYKRDKERGGRRSRENARINKRTK